MQTDFLNLNEAAAQIGKSTDTVRRLVKTLLRDDPNTPHVQRLPLENGVQMYFISTAYLAKHQASHTRTQVPPTKRIDETQAEPTHLLDELLYLRRQLEIKDQQIANFQERDREHNVLMRDLQQRLLLLEAPRTPEPEQPPTPQPKPQPEPLKRGFFWQRRRRRLGKK